MAHTPKKTPASLARSQALADAAENLLDVLTQFYPSDVDLAMAHRCIQAAQALDRFVVVLAAVTEAAGGVIEIPKAVADRVTEDDTLTVSFRQREDGVVVVRTSHVLDVEAGPTTSARVN
jgi:hypothetical protein